MTKQTGPVADHGDARLRSLIALCQVTSGDLYAAVTLSPCLTDVSRIRGTRRIRKDTEGHDGPRNSVQEDTGGTGGTLEDTTYVGFGTVRPRVQIPGPRPVFEYESTLCDQI